VVVWLIIVVFGFGFIITVVLCFFWTISWSGMGNGILSYFRICNVTYVLIVNNIIKIATHLAFPPKVIITYIFNKSCQCRSTDCLAKDTLGENSSLAEAILIKSYGILWNKGCIYKNKLCRVQLKRWSQNMHTRYVLTNKCFRKREPHSPLSVPDIIGRALNGALGAKFL
jgi:hypothetical protein